jgi:hypothetical protein
MIGSLRAAEAANGKAIAQRRGLPCRFLFAGAALALLAACSAATPIPPAAALPVAARPAEPRPLAGLSAKEVVALFGEPDFRRAEPPAELWQYRTADCVLDLFLYSDQAGAHVVHSETRDRSLVQAGAGHCAGAGDPLALRTRQSRL